MKTKILLTNYIDENDPQNVDFQSFSIVPKCFQYLKIISDVLKREYFIPILISVNPITYNLKSTITLVETFCYKEPTIYDIWKEKIYNRLVPFNLSESITNEILVVMSELIKEYEGDDDDDL